MLKNDSNRINMTIYLFDTCNLNCDFCYLNHTKLTTEQEILQKIDRYKEIIKRTKENYIYLKFLGGEIFADFVPDNYFKLYEDIILDLNSLCKSLNKTIVFDITTNIIHKNTERVFNLLNNLKDKVSVEFDTSFDFTSRFKNKENLETFKNNCYLYKDYITVVNTVMTSNLYRILVDKDIQSDQEKEELEVFNQLYNDNFPIMMAEYNNGAETIENNPLMFNSEEQFINFHKFLIDNYPRILEETFDNREKPSCYNRVTILNNKELHDCSFCSFGKLCGHDSLKNYVARYGCLTCSYYSRCSLYCDYFSKTFNQQDNCWKKEIFKYIEEKNGTSI